MLVFQKLTLAAVCYWIGGGLEWDRICDSWWECGDNSQEVFPKARKSGLVKVLFIVYFENMIGP